MPSWLTEITVNRLSFMIIDNNDNRKGKGKLSMFQTSNSTFYLG